MMSEHPFTNAAFVRHLAQHKLMATRCRSCQALHWPPRPLCPVCHSQDLVWEQMSGRGQLVAFTVVYVAPTAMLQAGYSREHPYIAGLVRLVEGPTVSAQIIGADPLHAESIRIGADVQVAFLDRHGENLHTDLAFEIVG